MTKATWISFDCYGTLIDWRRGMIGAMEPLARRHNISHSLEELQKRYVEIEAEVEEEEYRSYKEVLRLSLSRLFQELGVALEDPERSLFVRSLPTWNPFPEVRGSLEELKRLGLKLAVLSNVDRDLIEHSIRNIGVSFDRVVTAEETKSYKPALGHWETLLRSEGIEKGELLHVAASLYHDIAPARRLGIRNVWINRLGEEAPEEKPDYELHNLEELPRLVSELH